MSDHWLDWLGAGRYAELTQELTEAQARLERRQFDDRDYARALAALEDAPAERSHKFNEWVKVSEESGVALMARGLFWAQRAWEARGTAYVHKTSEEQFARMEEYFARAVPDLERAIAKLKSCALCYGALIRIAKARGMRAEKATLYNQAMENDPASITVPLAYFGSLEGKWGGHPGEALTFVRTFRKNYPSSPAAPVLEAELIVEEADTYYYGKRYADAIGFYERALAVDPKRAQTLHRYSYSLGQVNRRDAALEAINRSLAVNRKSAAARAHRAWLLLESQNTAEGLSDLAQAVALGDRWALRKALYVWSTGQYGQARDHAKTWALCEAAVKAANPDGYACTGGHYYFGYHVKSDKPEAAKWFRAAADRGVETAMIDLAVMLWTGDGVERDEAQAIQYWRTARALGEPRAEQKLRAHLSGWRYFYEVQVLDWWAKLKGLAGRLGRLIEIYLKIRGG